MGLETASYVANLVASNPDGGDQRSTADDHIRLIKAVMLRTWPKVDAAISLSAVQYMYLNDLSASVQLQLNQLRDGSATANNAVNSRFANSASVAANIGAIPAARVPDLAAANAFTAGNPLQLQNSGGYISWYNTAGSVRTGYFQMNAGTSVDIVAEQNIPMRFWTNNSLRMTIAADGTVTIPGAIVGTISNATSAVNATNASNATFASTASIATQASFANSASSAAVLAGLPPSDVGTPNTIVQRNSSGYIFGAYFNQSSLENEGGTITSLATFQGDNYLRKATPAQAGPQLETRNISGRTGTEKTLSSSAPTGGSNGDIWYQI